VHRALDEESVHGVSLEHEPVKQGLRLLKQAQGSVVLFLRNEVDCGIVQLVEDQRHLILVDVQLLRVQLLETVFTNIVDGPRAVGCLALQGVDVLHRGLFFARLSAGLFYIIAAWFKFLFAPAEAAFSLIFWPGPLGEPTLVAMAPMAGELCLPVLDEN
jgi:hypothetical protein